jgi:four helix bundle protein
MKYERFEDLPVWKSALDLAARMYALTNDVYFRQPGDLCNQLRRAALSKSNNIAEGFERGSTAELTAFLYIARGSAGEVCSTLRFVERDPEISNIKSEISNLISLSENCSRQIRGWADHLQNSEIKGQRHLTERSRGIYESKKATSEFLEQLQKLVDSPRHSVDSGTRSQA